MAVDLLWGDWHRVDPFGDPVLEGGLTGVAPERLDVDSPPVVRAARVLGVELYDC